MFPYRDNLTGGYRSPIIIAFLVLMVGITATDLAVGMHRRLVLALGFTPILFSIGPWTNSYTLISASLLHADLFHLAGNCLFLWVFGRSLERLFGWKAFALLFPVLGIAGFFVHWMISPASRVPVIGASGAIAALLGAYLALFPTARMRVALVWLPFWKRVTMPAWAFLNFWIGLQLVSLALGSGETDGVAYAVHVGAFALGLMGAAVWKTSYPSAEEDLQAFIASAFST